jgi:hypothetical protein
LLATDLIDCNKTRLSHILYIVEGSRCGGEFTFETMK